MSRIKILRKHLGLSQNEFAQRLGIKHGVVSVWERSNNIPLGRILLIANEFNVRREWLETGEGEMFATPEPTTQAPVQTPEEFAKSHGCDDFAAGIFARYCRFSDEDKRRFSELLQRLVNNPESVVGKIGGSSVAINNVFGDNNTHIN
ncbi:MAG: helix-turn-helix transcriptional regulator [Thermoguttaceae bacterium]|nr:helix-turn-helix transcriptional regulator [Thermoguttaceae bacterium]MBR4103860.1 helix-turn-helix transcriptional regulator [Thermoguttaceae bacterium]